MSSQREAVEHRASICPGRNQLRDFRVHRAGREARFPCAAPRFNLVRYHGVLAPSARWRPSVAPSHTAAGDIVSHPGCAAKKLDPRPEAKSSHKRRGCHPRNYSWSELMRRVFALDVLECPRCFGRMRVVAAIHPPEAIGKILDCLGLPSRAPPISPAVEEADWRY